MADPLWLVVLKLAAVVALVLLNAFFVAAEFAIVKVRATQVQARVRSGDPRAPTAHKVKVNLDAYLSACQLGITIASLGLGWIGEPAIADLLEPAFLRAGLEDPVVLHTVAFAIAFGTITFLHIVFGELAPKSIAIRTPEESTLRLARPLHIFYVLFRPAIGLLNGAANRFLLLGGFSPASGTEQAHSQAELREILAGTGEGGGGNLQRSRLLLNLLDLGARRAADIMTPITRVVVLDARRPLAENVRVAEESGYSRFPLVDGGTDNVVGMVHYKDIVGRVLRKDRPENDLLQVKRDVTIVPESQQAERLLEDMLRRAHHMAVIVDEHGRTVGIVTLEDIFEEVFGNIRDEFDEPEQPYKVLGEGVWLVEGTMALRDLEDLVGKEVRRLGVTTVGGLVTDVLGRLPMGGETLRLDGFDLTVREVGRRRVKSVEVRRAPAAAARADAEAAEPAHSPGS